ncbi:MAG: alpha/beta fold hydrolase [Terriglobales bacterium]
MTELVRIRSGKWEMSGVVHAPAVTPEKRVGVVLLHENFNTKFGTHRMFYQVGEALAAAGFYALRFDNRGMCDSPGINPLTFEDRVADADAATRFFKSEYRLDSVYFWGLCMGAAVAMHASGQSGPTVPEGIMLCSLLADPRDAALPQFGFASNPSRVVEGLSRGVLKKASRFATDATYRKNIVRLLKGVATRVAAREPELERLKKNIGEVGDLLRKYSGPIVLVFGDKDPCWTHFVEGVNANDKLGLAEMGERRKFLMLDGGDHTFSSRAQTEKVIEWTVEWAEALRDGRAAHYSYSKLEENRGIPVTSIAE